MKSSTAALSLSPSTPIDLQTHTHHSDGVWTPEALLDHVVSEGFGLIAITDHDRADTQAELQHLALDKHMPVLVATEMSAEWQGEPVDVLCFGFNPESNALNTLAQDVLRRQQANTQAAYDYLIQNGYPLPAEELTTILAKPSAQHPHALVALLKRQGYGTAEKSVGKILGEAKVTFATTPIATVVEAVHHDGGVCVIAHPGRGDGFVNFDTALLDELRQTVPIDGLEVHYPAHSPEQIALYLDYAQRHHLLTSSGSDSHTPEKPPIKYRAELSRNLLDRVGIRIA